MDLVAAAIAFDLFDKAFDGFSLFSPLTVDTFAFDFFDGAAVGAGFDSLGGEFDKEAAELLRRTPRPCELDESESELDEFEFESLELPLDDDEPELEQLESLVVTDWK